MSLSSRSIFSDGSKSALTPLEKFNKIYLERMSVVDVLLDQKADNVKELQRLDVAREELVQKISSLDETIYSQGQFPLDDLKDIFIQKIQQADPKIEILSLTYGTYSSSMKLILRTKEPKVHEMRDFLCDQKIIDDKLIVNQTVVSTRQGLEFTIRLKAPGWNGDKTFEWVYASLTGQQEVHQQDTPNTQSLKI